MHDSSSSFSPTLAFTAAATDPASRLHWVGDQADAVEFSPDPNNLEWLEEAIRPFLSKNHLIRYHARYFEHELGHADQDLADLALDAHLRTLRAMVGLGEPVVTVHTGLDPSQPVHESTFMENLARLVAYGKDMGIVVCLENLRCGPSSEPANVLRWAEWTGAMITLDVGHALGSEAARDGRCPVEGFVDLFADRLFEVHIYGREDDQGHHPIEDIVPFRPLMAKLLQTECVWWTIELQRPEHALETRALLLNELDQAVPPSLLSHYEAEPHPVFPMRSRLVAPGQIRPCSLLNFKQAPGP
jgi:sugar phosphate isomerase/epimerase